MRLRYLSIKNYPPLRDIALSFSAESPLKRECAIRFVVGVNGSGKTHLLQALLEVFLCLARQQKPHFPVTLVYDLGKGDRARTLIFHNPSGAGKPGWWQSTSNQHRLLKNNQLDDWQQLISTVQQGDNRWEPLIKDGSWPGKKVGLPRMVIAYTTGERKPWKEILHSEPPADEVDIVSQSLDYDTTQERPQGWSLQKEIDFQSHIGTEEAKKILQNLKIKQSESGTRESEQEICQLITPLLLKFALLSVSLPLAMEEFRTHKTEKDQKTFIQEISTEPDQAKGLRRLFNQVGWVWPVCISFTVDFNPNDWSEAESKFKKSLFKNLYGFAGEVIREPEPKNRRRLFFDLLAKDKGNNNNEYVGDALLDFLGGRSNQPNDYFKRLLDLRQQGIIEDIQIAIRCTSTEDLLLFDELSDGEQVFLGRMALFHLMQGEDDALLLLDEPEVHFNDKWKREIVDIIDDVLQDTANDVLIATHSSITLTDVFNDEIILFKKQNGSSQVVPIRSTTFGADPSEVMIRVFDVPDSIGERAMEWLDKQLDRDWTQANREELKDLIKKVGPGFHRSELRAILRRLEKSAS